MDGIRSHTQSGRVRWERKSTPTGDTNVASSISRSFLNSLREPKIFVAHGGGAMYEISSSDGYGGAPYEFRVWEFEGTKMRPVGMVESSTNVADGARFSVNEALQRLFLAVDESTESGEEIVDRLLDGL